MSRGKKNTKRRRSPSHPDSTKRKGKSLGALELYSALLVPVIGSGCWVFLDATAYPWSYPLGIFIFYAGFIVWVVRSVWGPASRIRRRWKIVSVLFAVGFAVLFTFNVVLVKAPLKFDAYAMHHPDGDRVAGMRWNSHFTDLRVWIMNPSKKDYKSLYINLLPDQWTYKARFVGNDEGCRLVPTKAIASIHARPNGGGNPTQFVVHQHQFHFSADDNLGHDYPLLIRKGGYRVECSHLSAHDQLQIMIALASPNGIVNAQSRLLPRQDSGKWGAVVGQVNGGAFRVLGPRPDSHIVRITGHYNLGPKRFTLKKRKKVSIGD